ncbi:tripartite tricarboxylate transporter substrate binding protein [Nonomuraea sp. NPDC000554]|uniref:Bug family tripartite tricarboxylate transporter substrate binding protein n=1 Tax=Nonomuraea sp. NPDC000554 TaxID=3154259 RepID=UPI00331CDB7D
MKRRLSAIAAVIAVTTAGCGQLGQDAGGPFPSANVEIMVPAAPGGGWDLTARSMQQVLKEGKLVDQPVEVFNVVGAGGTVGLSQLVNKGKGDAHQWMVTGLVMVGAIVQNKAATDLTQVTPIATLTAEPEVVVVRADSKYRTLKDLLADAGRVKWGGGSVGGTDHLLVGMLAKAAGGTPKNMQYVGYSGGGEAKAGVLSGDVTAAVSGVSEFESLIKSGELRALAVSGATGVTVAGRPVPSIKEAGFEAELMNWRALVAPPGVSDADAKAVGRLVDTLHSSPQWQAILKKQGWTDYYRSGQEAKDFIAGETTRIKKLVAELGLA